MNGGMFEKVNPLLTFQQPLAGGVRPDEIAGRRRALPTSEGERFESRRVRRAGDALRAVEWSEITARLNAARDLRLLLRTESKSPIEAVAASFGDAAASYFALLDDSKPDVNQDALGQSKALDAMLEVGDANRPAITADASSDASRGDAREMQ